MKKFFLFFILLFPILATAQESRPVSIVYENDAHSVLSGYPKVVALKKIIQKDHPDVLVVSGGDFSTDFMPTPSLGRNTKGAGIIEVLNAAGYDFVVPGNHDFDFSVQNLQENEKNLNATMLCCNCIDLKTGEPVFRSYAIREIGGMKIAFIGAVTPTAISKHTQSVFSDAEGNLLYSFSAETLPELVQQNVDKARAEGADVVILLSHLGDKPNGTVTSRDVISKTSGIDVVLDAHAHSVIEGENVQNKDGKDVLLASTGLKFANVGILSIAKTSDSLIPVFTLIQSTAIEPDAQMQAAIDKINGKYME